MEVGDVHPSPFGINLASFFFCSVFLLTLFADCLDGRLSLLLVKVLEQEVNRSVRPQPIGDSLHPF
jgi:hypothetical protein